MGQYRFINYKKCYHCDGGVDNGSGNVCGGRNYMEKSVYLLSILPKSAQKKKSELRKKEKVIKNKKRTRIFSRKFSVS